MSTYWVWWRFVNNSPKQPKKIEADTVEEAIEQSTIYDPRIRSEKGERMHFIVVQEAICAGSLSLIVAHTGPVESEPIMELIPKSFMELLVGERNGSKKE